MKTWEGTSGNVMSGSGNGTTGDDQLTLHDTNNIKDGDDGSAVPCRALCVTASGTLKVTMAETGRVAEIPFGSGGFALGVQHAIAVTKIHSTGTVTITADDVWAFF